MARGFTLVELMFALGVMSTVSVVAIGSEEEELAPARLEGPRQLGPPGALSHECCVRGASERELESRPQTTDVGDFPTRACCATADSGRYRSTPRTHRLIPSLAAKRD